MAYPEDKEYLKAHAREMEYIDPAAGTSTFFNIVGDPIHGEEAFKGLVAAANIAHEIFVVTWMLDPEMELIRDGWDKPVKDPARQAIRVGPVLLKAAKARANVYAIIWDPTALFSSSMAELEAEEMLPPPDITEELVGAAGKIDRWRDGWREARRISNAVKQLRLDLRAISLKNEILLQAHPTFKAGSHHQKFWIFRRDNQLTAFVGGINLNQLAWDDQAHTALNPRRNPADMEGSERKARFDRGDPPKDLPRHDWMVQVDGHAAHALLEEFYARWAQSPPAPPPKVLPKPTDVVAKGKMFVQVSRMWPKDPVPGQVLKAYEKAFAKASKYIYVENQYWTHPGITDLLIQRLSEDSPPKLIIVLPFKPEEEGKVAQWIVAEQYFHLNRLMSRFGFDKVMVYQLFRKHPSRNEYFNVYVHAKLAIVDDRWMTVGSTNTNNRSLSLCDSESNVQFAHEEHVTRVRKQIWKEMVGPDGEGSDPLVAIEQGFRRIGVRNEQARREGREMTGLVLPNRLDEAAGKRPPEWARKYL